MHLDRGYDSTKTRQELTARGLHGHIAQKGKPAPIQVGMRWVVERTKAWRNAHRKLVLCTDAEPASSTSGSR